MKQPTLSQFMRFAKQHIAAMADDAYLTGHPEWVEIANEAHAILFKSGTGGAA